MDSHSTSWHLGTTKPTSAKRNSLATGEGRHQAKTFLIA